ncbi:MAG: hypothetical protein KC419_08140 [Anaerolineales bacterium]|nr:hypothetical protein [Anaerolineales bacterium]MCA9928431.1 hypothetical protein [Anaerolineales bacterium]
MAKTAQAVGGKRFKFEISITAELVAALAYLTTVETVDISSITKAYEGGAKKRPVNKEWVSGDKDPISEQDDQVTVDPATLSFLYTNGKETLGTDGFDFGKLLNDVIMSDGALSLPYIVSVAGGNTGDEEWASDTTQTFVTEVANPAGSVDTAGKVQRTCIFDSSTLTPATVA